MNFLCQIRNFTCIQKNCQRTTYFHPYYWTIGEVLNVILLRILDGHDMDPWYSIVKQEHVRHYLSASFFFEGYLGFLFVSQL